MPAKTELAKQIINEVDGGGKIRTADLEKASKGALEALLTAVKELKKKHAVEMKAAVEDSKIN